MEHAPLETPERTAFYARIDRQNLTPLWSVMNALITPEPKSACVPAIWRFDEVRTAMLEAGALITAKEAEHRVGRRRRAGGPRLGPAVPGGLRAKPSSLAHGAGRPIPLKIR